MTLHSTLLQYPSPVSLGLGRETHHYYSNSFLHRTFLKTLSL